MIPECERFLNYDMIIILSKTTELDRMQFGVYQARRGWLTKDDVINTYPLKKMMSTIKK